jgi:predicted N-acetyltransferase YhbS
MTNRAVDNPYSDFTIRVMNEADINGGLHLCRSSSWNQLREDWEHFLRLNPGGSRVAERAGEIIGTVATIRYAQEIAWIGMMLVDPDHRRSGVGSALFSESLAILQDIPTVRLDATPAGEPLYAKFGFVKDFGLSRMVLSNRAAVGNIASARVSNMTTADLQEVAELDRRVFGVDRQPLLTALLRRSPAQCWILRPKLYHAISGFSLSRPGAKYRQIGPIIADSLDAANEILLHCLATFSEQSLVVDVPTASTEWIQRLAQLGFREERAIARMSLGEPQNLAGCANLFAIVGPEFG